MAELFVFRPAPPHTRPPRARLARPGLTWWDSVAGLGLRGAG